MGDARIRDVLRSDVKNAFQIMGGQQTVADAVDAFVASLERSEPLHAIIVTRTGKAADEVLGIATPWDFVSLAGSGV